ncbi:MAG: hypothetical protein WAM85_16395 [Terracidiphilus sp.]
MMLNVGTPELNSTANVLVTPPALAVSVTAWEVLNDETVAVNPTLVALAGTVTEAGTAITALLLDKLTLNPPLPAAALNATVQASVPAPVIDPLVQVSALNTGAAAAPVPLKLITADGLVEELLVMANCPVAAPAVVGSNCTFSVAAWFGLKVTGKVAPDIVKPVPVSAAALIVTGALPVEVKVTDCVDGVFSATFPKANVAVLMLRVGTVALNCRAKLFETLPEVPVSVTAWAVVTDVTVAENPILVAAAGTVTEPGTVTAELLLDKLMVSPPAGAAPLSVTVQASVPDPVMDPALQASALSVPAAATPEPLRLTVAVELVEELLVTVSIPVNELT